MRLLVVPACVCVMATWSGATGADPKMSFDRLADARLAKAVAGQSGDTQEPAAAEDLEAAASSLDGRDTGISDAPEEAAVVPIDPSITVPQNGNVPALSEPAPLPKPKPEIKPVIHRSTEEVCDTLTKAAQNNGLPVPYFIRLLFQESGFSPGVVSNAGAQGIAQFMPETASDMGVDNPFDPLQAIPASARLLRNLFDKFGNLGLAAAAYNAGPKRIQDWLAKKGPLPEETQGYVKTITGRPAENWKTSESGAPAMKVQRRAPCQDAAGLLAWNGPDQIPVPSIAPHRRVAEPTVVANAAPAKSPEAKPAQTKTANVKTTADIKIVHGKGHATTAIRVADASGAMPKTKAKATKSEAKKDGAKTDAVQLAARKQHKKMRLSER